MTKYVTRKPKPKSRVSFERDMMRDEIGPESERPWPVQLPQSTSSAHLPSGKLILVSCECRLLEQNLRQTRLDNLFVFDIDSRSDDSKNHPDSMVNLSLIQTLSQYALLFSPTFSLRSSRSEEELSYTT